MTNSNLDNSNNSLQEGQIELTTDSMEQALRSINFFVGGLTEEGIEYYYYKMVAEGKI